MTIDEKIWKLRRLTSNFIFIEYYPHDRDDCYKILNEHTFYAEDKHVLCKVSEGFELALDRAVECISKAMKEYELEWDRRNKRTDVKFYFDRDSEDVFAYFPSEESDLNGNKTCFAHIGGHSGCSPKYIKECKEAPPEAYNDLKTELESIGYKLNIL